MEGLRAMVIQSQDTQTGGKLVTEKKKKRQFHRVENFWVCLFCFVWLELDTRLDFGELNSICT